MDVGRGVDSGVGMEGGFDVAVGLISDSVAVGLACSVNVGSNSSQAITETRIADKASKAN